MPITNTHTSIESDRVLNATYTLAHQHTDR